MFNLSYRQRVFFSLLGLFGCLVTSQARTQSLSRHIPSSNQALNTSAQWGVRSSGLAFQQFVNALPPARVRTGLVEPQPRGQINSNSRRGQTLSLSDGNSHIVEQRPVVLNNSRGFTPFAFNSFPGFSFEDNGNTCGDTASGPYLALAVSQKYVVQLVNDCFSIYDKQGNLQPGYPKSLAVFFGVTVLGGNGQIFYDWVANRFVIGQLTSGNDGGVLYVAASASSDPTGAWHIYRLPVGGTGLFADYLQLGHNNGRDPFGGDIAVSFVLNNGSAGSQILFLPKAKVYAGAGFGYNFVFNLSINGVLSNFVVPARVSSPYDEPRAQFAVHSMTSAGCSPTCNGLAVWAFSNVLQNPGSPGPDFSVFVIPTPSDYQFPPGEIDQPGNNPLFLLAGAELKSPVSYASGSLFATLNADNRGGTGILAWQFHPYLDDNGDGHCTGAFLNACPRIIGGSLEQELNYLTNAGAGFNAFDGVIQPDPERNFTMVFNYMDAFSTYLSTAYTSNRVTQISGAWHDSGFFLLPMGSGLYTYGNAVGPAAWAEWNATALDLSTRPASIWVTGGYARGDGAWGTTIGKMAFANSAQP